MLPECKPCNLHDLAHICWVDLYCADRARPLTAAGEELDGLL